MQLLLSCAYRVDLSSKIVFYWPLPTYLLLMVMKSVPSGACVVDSCRES